MLRQADFYKSVNYNCIYYTIHEAVVIGEEILDEEAKVSHVTKTRPYNICSDFSQLKKNGNFQLNYFDFFHIFAQT